MSDTIYVHVLVPKTDRFETMHTTRDKFRIGTMVETPDGKLAVVSIVSFEGEIYAKLA